MQIAVTLPEGTWAPVTYEFWDHMPAQTGISGPVALVSEDGLVTGLVPGTCTLRVKAEKKCHYTSSWTRKVKYPCDISL